MSAAQLLLPPDYLASRERFCALAAQAGATQRSFAHETVGDVSLSTDTAYLGDPQAQNLVVIASGTHGVEGYGGALCQFHFLNLYRDRFADPDTAFLLVHAVNPWGFFRDRRVTREGVDLNRNFTAFPRPASGPSAYAAYHRLLVADFQPLPAGLMNELRMLGHALVPARRKAARAAITGGQYDHPDGLFFGGGALTACRQVWEEVVHAYASNRGRVLLMDIHTGLGKRGALEVISYLPDSDTRFKEMEGWFQGREGARLRSMASGASVSAQVQGDLTAGFDRLIGSGADALGLEFGTASPLAILYALRYDQWVHNHANHLGPRERAEARRRMKAAFAPQDPLWCRQVLAGFEQALAAVLDHFPKAQSA